MLAAPFFTTQSFGSFGSWTAAAGVAALAMASDTDVGSAWVTALPSGSVHAQRESETERKRSAEKMSITFLYEQANGLPYIRMYSRWRHALFEFNMPKKRGKFDARQCSIWHIQPLTLSFSFHLLRLDVQMNGTFFIRWLTRSVSIPCHPPHHPPALYAIAPTMSMYLWVFFPCIFDFTWMLRSFNWKLLATHVHNGVRLHRTFPTSNALFLLSGLSFRRQWCVNEVTKNRIISIEFFEWFLRLLHTKTTRIHSSHDIRSTHSYVGGFSLFAFLFALCCFFFLSLAIWELTLG